MAYEVQITAAGLTITNTEELQQAVAMKKQLDDAIETFKSNLKDQMELEGITEFECSCLKAQFIEKKDTEEFDKKALEKDNPELYAKYVKIKKNKPSFRVDFKG